VIVCRRTGCRRFSFPRSEKRIVSDGIGAVRGGVETLGCVGGILSRGARGIDVDIGFLASFLKGALLRGGFVVSFVIVMVVKLLIEFNVDSLKLKCFSMTLFFHRFV
jgi:hypothetical protein